MARSERMIAYSALAAVFFFWGTTYLAIRIGLETLPPTLFAGIRFITAGTLLFAFLRGWRKEKLPKGREWLHQAIVGLMLLGVGNGFVVWAEVWIPSGMAALLVATSPFWVAGFERLRRDGERVSLRALVGMLIGFGGLVLLVAPGLFGEPLGPRYLLGMIAIQIGCASWSGGSIFIKHHETKAAPPGWIVLAEPLGWRMMTAMLIILGGVALVKTATKSAASSAAQQATTSEATLRAEVLRPTPNACSVTTP